MSETREELLPVGALLDQIERACSRMSAKNPHRALLKQCAHTIAYFAAQQQPVEARTPAGIILPNTGIIATRDS